MKIEVRYKDHGNIKGKTYVYTTNSFFKFISIWLVARRSKAEAVLTYF